MRYIGPARLALLATAMAVGAFLGSAAPAHGASFTVNATYDAVDASPGDGVCADAKGACTLRAAVMETNALPGADEISLPAGTYVLSIPGAGEDASATGDLDVTDDLTINGAGRDTTVIDGGGLDRVFHALGSIRLTFLDLTIQNGVAGGSANVSACNTGPDPADPAFATGGGVCSEFATLEFAHVELRNNSAGVGGAAIHSMAKLAVQESIVTGNDGILGAVFNGGTATIESSMISDNHGAVSGGGIHNQSNATLTLDNSTVSGNAALDGGGGILNLGTTSIRATTIANNRAGQSGGGILNSAFSVLGLTNSTISGNTARFGGGIYNSPEPLPPGLSGGSAVGPRARSLGGLVTGTNVTLAGNSASQQGGGILNPDAAARSGTVNLENSIVANGPAGRDCSGVVASGGHNLDSDGSCGLGGPGDISNADPLLGPLADNGGPTQTYALLGGSPAIDAGDNIGCPATDQRGVVRPQNGDGADGAICDIGAFELEGPPPVPCPGAQPCQTVGPVEMPMPTPALPIAFPRTGGASAGQGAPLVAVVAALSALAGAAALARLRRKR